MTDTRMEKDIDSALAQELISHLESSRAFYQEFRELEQLKYNAISQNRLADVADIVKMEEASLLKAKGFERRREQILTAMGMTGRTMSEVMAGMDPPLRAKANAMYLDFTQLLLDLKEINQRCSAMAELRLRRTEALRKKLESQPGLQQLYTEHAQPSPSGGSVMSKMI